MRPWKPYLWKEFRENRWFALAALGVFLGISFVPQIVEALRLQQKWYGGPGPLLMLFLGGPILAMVTGVYAMGREQGAIERFWRSRPVNLNRWLVIKYLVGVSLVWLVCWTPLAIQILGKAFEQPYGSGSDRGTISMPLVYSFILLLIYSVSFLLGQCVRGVLHAAILSVGAMALIFIIPLAVGPLNWLSVETLLKADNGTLDARSHIIFVTTMTAFSVVLLGLAGILWRRNVMIDVDQRTLGWSVAIILLALAAGVAFPIGTNLVPTQVISLPITGDSGIEDLAVQGSDILALVYGDTALKDPHHGFVRVHVAEETSVVGEPIWLVDLDRDPKRKSSVQDLVWSVEDPSLAYMCVRQYLEEDVTLDGVPSVPWLYTVALDANRSDPIIHRVELNPGAALSHLTEAIAYLHRGRLYIRLHADKPAGERLLTFSLADPKAPSLIHSQDLVDRIGWQQENLAKKPAIRLVPIPDLDDSARLEITHGLIHYHYWTPTEDGRVLVSDFDEGTYVPRLTLYETEPSQDDRVLLHPIARRRSVALEGFLQPWLDDLLYSAPFAYRMEGNGVTAYRINHSREIERIGHYVTTERFRRMVPLPGNRLVIAGDRLHVLDLSKKLPPLSVR